MIYLNKKTRKVKSIKEVAAHIRDKYTIHALNKENIIQYKLVMNKRGLYIILHIYKTSIV